MTNPDVFSGSEIFGVDVGSVRRKGGFSWSTADGAQRGQDDPSQLGDAVVSALESGRVALALECPLSVPVPAAEAMGWADLGRARAGEHNRSWSAGAGAGVLATGLVQLPWLLRYVADRSTVHVVATTQPDAFLAGRANLLIAEAMVTSDGKPEPVDGQQDHADALAAARRLAELLTMAASGDLISDVSCLPHVALNLAASAAMHAGLLLDPAELRQDVLVAKARPVIK
ncbi:hypothetical protein [Flexivirga lutea]